MSIKSSSRLTLIALPVFGHAATTEQALPAEVTETAGDGDGFDWNKLIDAIAHFESKGNARAVNGQYVGLLQISPVLVRECNNILKARGESKRYTLKDRYNAEKSREMFAIIQSHHNPSNSIERAIRIWKGGIGYSIRKTQNYVNRVLERMDCRPATFSSLIGLRGIAYDCCDSSTAKNNR